MAKLTKVDHGAEVAEVHGIRRSPNWPAKEKAFRKANPTCACCGRSYPKAKGIQVHHRRPFHDCILAGRPDLELDDRNLISLCENEAGIETLDCHISCGHLADFKSYNPTVTEDAAGCWHGKGKTDIEADPAWPQRIQNRPKSYPDMTPDEKQAFRALIDQEMPKQDAPIAPSAP